MKTTLITTASDPQHPGWLQFKRSLDHFGWDYHLIVHEYTGFNSKIVAFYDYLVAHPEITHFIYADSYDSFALGTQQEVENKFENWDGLTYSVEKACWPYEDWAKEYPESPYPHKYLNGGGFMGSSSVFIQMYEANPIDKSEAINDQVWAANIFLRGNNGSLKLDRDCSIFQTIGHSGKGDFAVFGGKRVMNVHAVTCPVIFHGNGHEPMGWVWDLLPEKVMINEKTTLAELQASWQDTEAYHKEINEVFTANVAAHPLLGVHRHWVSSHAHGFGENSFWWMWKLICDELPVNPAMMEVGVYMSATLSVWRLLRPDAHIFGITPLDSSDGHLDVPYLERIQQIHDEFKQPMPHLFVGRSDAPEVVEKAGLILYDTVYVDGSHQFKDVCFDLNTYSKMVKKGGYFAVDDSACRTKQPWGYFQGIKDVCDALERWETSDLGKEFEFLGNVVHLMVYKRK